MRGCAAPFACFQHYSRGSPEHGIHRPRARRQAGCRRVGAAQLTRWIRTDAPSGGGRPDLVRWSEEGSDGSHKGSVEPPCFAVIEALRSTRSSTRRHSSSKKRAPPDRRSKTPSALVTSRTAEPPRRDVGRRHLPSRWPRCRSPRSSTIGSIRWLARRQTCRRRGRHRRCMRMHDAPPNPPRGGGVHGPLARAAPRDESTSLTRGATPRTSRQVAGPTHIRHLAETEPPRMNMRVSLGRHGRRGLDGRGPRERRTWQSSSASRDSAWLRSPLWRHDPCDAFACRAR